jgi:hypothetical protein
MMSPEELPFRAQVLLSVQRALWDLVTPKLRGVALKISETDRSIVARFIYARGLTLVLDEIVSEAEAYVAADFDDTVTFHFSAQYVPTENSRDLEVGEEWVYRRREEEIEADEYL